MPGAPLELHEREEIFRALVEPRGNVRGNDCWSRLSKAHVTCGFVLSFESAHLHSGESNDPICRQEFPGRPGSPRSQRRLRWSGSRVPAGRRLSRHPAWE